MDTFKVIIWLNNSSQPLHYDAINAYTKDSFYCVLFMKGDIPLVHKYPIDSIFRIQEEYKYVKPPRK